MNRRRTVKPHLGFGSVVMLIVAAVVMSSAGVFHAYIKNRQINVAREIQAADDRISQHKLDISTIEIRLSDELNPILINDRLTEISSDLRPIPVNVVQDISPSRIPAVMAEVTDPSPPEVAGLVPSGP